MTSDTPVDLSKADQVGIVTIDGPISSLKLAGFVNLKKLDVEGGEVFSVRGAVAGRNGYPFDAVEINKSL